MITINIPKDFTDSVGGRYISEGEWSGELFREKYLIPKYLEAKEKGEKLIIIFDGGYGYPTSFLEEAFGGLARKYDKQEINSVLEYVSDENERYIESVENYINNARNKK